MLKKLKWVKKYLDEILTRNSLHVFPFSLSFKFEVYGNLCIERPLGIDSGQPFPSVPPSTLGKTSSAGREEEVLIAISVGQVGDAGSGTDSRFHNSFWEMARKWLALVLLAAAQTGSNGMSPVILATSRLPQRLQRLALALTPAVIFFQCLLPWSTSALPKVTSCLL